MSIRHIEALTAQVYKLPQYSYAQLKSQDNKLSKALWAINFWYDDSDANAARRLEKTLQPIVSLFPYKPWGKSVFRAIRVPNYDKYKEGKTYVLKTGASSVQSWTTSVDKAKDFGNEFSLGSDFIVVQLMDTGHELSNYDWMMSVALYLSSPVYKELSTWKAAVSLVDTLKRFKAEDEVIMKLNKLVKVRVVHIEPNV